MNLRFEAVLPTDPIAALHQLTESECELECLRFSMVKRAREVNRSWEDVASALGVSRQSAWQFYAPRILRELDREENTAAELTGEEADEIAVSESRVVRQRRRHRPA